MIRSPCRNEDNENDSFQENNHAPRFVIDGNGRLLDVNDAFCQKLGCNKDEFIGLRLIDTGLLTEESRKKMKYRHIFRLIGKRKPRYTINVMTKNRGVLTLIINTKPFIKDGRTVGEIGVVQKTLEFSKPEKGDFRGEELEKTLKELERVRFELDLKLWELRKIQFELEKKREEVETLNEDLETRNRIIEEINSQLMEKQTSLVEKTSENRKLQTNLDQIQKELLTRDEELRTVKLELEDRCDELESLTANLKIRDAIIEKIKEQLTEKQMLLVEKTESVGRLQTELEQKRREIEENTKMIAQLETEKDFTPRQQPQESLIDESIDFESRKSIVGELGAEREREEKEIGFVEGTEEEQTILTERLKLYEEIDKVLDRYDDALKTKKVEDEE